MRGCRYWLTAITIALTPLPAASQAAPSGYTPPEHKRPLPDMMRRGRTGLTLAADDGIHVEQRRSVAQIVEQQEKIARIGAKLAPQRPGVVDAYVIAAALDSDGVFGREAREVAKVLERRYDAAGRSIVLAGSDGSGPSPLANGSPTALAVALGRAAKAMDRNEDVLILFTTSHGMPGGVVYHDGDSGYGGISPTHLAAMLDELGIKRRLLVISACFSGQFADRLAAPDTAILTASHADRTSFGCAAENDWTYFGDALVNRALRQPQPLEAAFAQAAREIASWEGEIGGDSSLPQIRVGEGAKLWLKTLDAKAPAQAGAPVGKPAHIRRVR